MLAIPPMIWIWIAFIAFVLLMLALDLGVFHRHAHEVNLREAMLWSAVWITLGLLFSVFVYFAYDAKLFGLGTEPDAVDGLLNSGASATQKYLLGYVIEKSLSVDNIFVIAIIFDYFHIPRKHQHRVLFWGILGALVLRGLMIALGARLVAEFHWILYLFAIFLILTALKMLLLTSESPKPGRNLLVRLIRRVLPVTERLYGQRFVLRASTIAALSKGRRDGPDPALEHVQPGKLLLTPLALALIVVETSDVIFAIDSIPAIFAITADPLLVFTSNVFAILGLRSLYFALSAVIARFHYLKTALALVLMVVGIKMLLADWLHALVGSHFNLYLLVVVLAILASGVLVSLIVENRTRQK